MSGCTVSQSLLILYQICLPTVSTHFMYSIIRDYKRITQRNWIIFGAFGHVFFTNGVLLPIIIWCTKNTDDVWSTEYAFYFMLALFMWRKNFVIEIFRRICLCERLNAYLYCREYFSLRIIASYVIVVDLISYRKF